MDVFEAKRRLRAEAEARRNEIARSGRAEKAAAAAERLIAAIPMAPGDIVSSYAPIGTELDPLPLAEALVSRGVRIALPVIVARGAPLLFREWRPGLPLKRGLLGVMQPPEAAPEVTPRIVVTPLLAFDRAGHRLGYGAGYYDRTLAALRARRKVVAVGYAFAGQEVDAVPADALDQRLDWLATERECRPVEPARSRPQPSSTKSIP